MGKDIADAIKSMSTEELYDYGRIMMSLDAMGEVVKHYKNLHDEDGYYTEIGSRMQHAYTILWDLRNHILIDVFGVDEECVPKP